jgi:hypothetical protein
MFDITDKIKHKHIKKKGKIKKIWSSCRSLAFFISKRLQKIKIDKEETTKEEKDREKGEPKNSP